MAILGTLRIDQQFKKKHEWFSCDLLGFVTGLGDGGLQKDQGNDVLDAIGLKPKRFQKKSCNSTNFASYIALT